MVYGCGKWEEWGKEIENSAIKMSCGVDEVE